MISQHRNKTILITGSNRGIGFELCKQYAQDNWDVIACYRSMSDQFNLLVDKYTNIKPYRLDVTDESSIIQLTDLITIPIDIIISNAGVKGDQPSNLLDQINIDNWKYVFHVNTIAPVQLASKFALHLRNGSDKLFVAISTNMASIADNIEGGDLFYRSSKAALNCAMKTISIELRPIGIGILTIHPGWVRTDMGGFDAPLSVVDSASALRNVIESFNLQNTGNFVNIDGEQINW